MQAVRDCAVRDGAVLCGVVLCVAARCGAGLCAAVLCCALPHGSDEGSQLPLPACQAARCGDVLTVPSVPLLRTALSPHYARQTGLLVQRSTDSCGDGRGSGGGGSGQAAPTVLPTRGKWVEVNGVDGLALSPPPLSRTPSDEPADSDCARLERHRERCPVPADNGTGCTVLMVGSAGWWWRWQCIAGQ
jgi:hypothetical protein